MARNDRWAVSWTEDFCRGARNAFLIALALFLLVIFVMFLASLFGCASRPPIKPAKHTEKFIEYHGEAVNGIIAKTEKGNYLVTPGYVRWAEGLAIDNEDLKAKLEQERLAKILPAIQK